MSPAAIALVATTQEWNRGRSMVGTVEAMIGIVVPAETPTGPQEIETET